MSFISAVTRFGLLTGGTSIAAAGVYGQAMMNEVIPQCPPVIATGGIVTGALLGVAGIFAHRLFSEKPPCNIKKNLISFDQHKPSHIVFVRDNLQCDETRTISFFCDGFGSFLETIPAGENVIAFADECFNLDLHIVEGDKDWHKKSLLAQCMQQWKVKNPNIFLLLGAYFMDANANSWKVFKHDSLEEFEIDSIAIRICAELNSSPLNSAPHFYLVPACDLSDTLSPPHPNQTIYVNDRLKGVRRFLLGNDSGWLPPTPAQVKTLDDENHTHYIFEIGNSDR